MPAKLEQARLATLDSLGLLDTPPEREFDAIVQLAQRLTGSKIALMSLVDKDRQWFKARIGLDVDHTPRELAFCAHAIAADDVMIVPDASMDMRFSANPLVTGAPNIRFYAGVPIRAEMPGCPATRLPLGTLCVIDDEPRDGTPDDIALLVELANLVETLIVARSRAASAVRFAEERIRVFHELDRKHRQLRQAERIANIGSWRLTLADNRVEWSEQTYAIHGVPVGDSALERTATTGEMFDVETDFTNARGEDRRVRSMGEREVGEDGAVALIGVFQDVTARFMMEEALRRAAYTDELTRIASRARFNEFVDERIEVAATAGDGCALLLIDLDHFKVVNDTCGHQAGDDVLRVMASRLQAPYLAGSFAARLGGDEFVLLVTDPAILGDLSALLRRLLCELRHSVRANGHTLHVSATIGACWLSDETPNRSELLRNADMALYAAKRSQRGSAMIAGQDELIVLGQDDPPALRLVTV